MYYYNKIKEIEEKILSYQYLYIDEFKNPNDNKYYLIYGKELSFEYLKNMRYEYNIEDLYNLDNLLILSDKQHIPDDLKCLNKFFHVVDSKFIQMFGKKSLKWFLLNKIDFISNTFGYVKEITEEDNNKFIIYRYTENKPLDKSIIKYNHISNPMSGTIAFVLYKNIYRNVKIYGGEPSIYNDDYYCSVIDGLISPIDYKLYNSIDIDFNTRKLFRILECYVEEVVSNLFNIKNINFLTFFLLDFCYYLEYKLNIRYKKLAKFDVYLDSKIFLTKNIYDLFPIKIIINEKINNKKYNFVLSKNMYFATENNCEDDKVNRFVVRTFINDKCINFFLNKVMNLYG